MRTMYDAVNLDAIPTNAAMIGAYIDGNWPTYDQAKQRWPNAIIIPITTGTGLAATVNDCETGNATPAQAAQWAKAKHERGEHPTIYCNSSTWSTCWNECKATGLDPVADVSWWIAQWDGVASLPAGTVAKQYGAPDNHTTPGGYDVSAVADYWPGVDAAPSEDNMLGSVTRDPRSGGYWTITPSRTKHPIHSATDLTNMLKSGQYVRIDLTAAEIDSIKIA